MDDAAVWRTNFAEEEETQMYAELWSNLKAIVQHGGELGKAKSDAEKDIIRRTLDAFTQLPEPQNLDEMLQRNTIAVSLQGSWNDWETAKRFNDQISARASESAANWSKPGLWHSRSVRGHLGKINYRSSKTISACVKCLEMHPNH